MKCDCRVDCRSKIEDRCTQKSYRYIHCKSITTHDHTIGDGRSTDDPRHHHRSEQRCFWGIQYLVYTFDAGIDLIVVIISFVCFRHTHTHTHTYIYLFIYHFTPITRVPPPPGHQRMKACEIDIYVCTVRTIFR